MKQIKKYKYLITIILILSIIVLGIIIKINLDKNKELNIDNEIFSYEKEEDVKEKISEYKVDIKGAIANPGVYIGNDNTRVIDQTCPIMIQKLNNIFQRNPLISMGI